MHRSTQAPYHCWIATFSTYGLGWAPLASMSVPSCANHSRLIYLIPGPFAAAKDRVDRDCHRFLVAFRVPVYNLGSRKHNDLLEWLYMWRGGTDKRAEFRLKDGIRA
ncbi:hypothetical protein BJV77DRAFT_961954 [Russula vinacea]|nr:hypothetical protein BJV77DRAFT_961954 [Russula vinacea]